MDTPVVVALIGAGGLIVAAVIPILLQRRSGSHNNTPVPSAQAATSPEATTVADLEQALRQDSRIQRLLANRNWNDAAEAAIAYFCRGVDCPVESWSRTTTSQLVGAVHAELCNQGHK